MTGEQQAAIRALRRCTFTPGSPDKRFVRFLSECLDSRPDQPLTERQATRLQEKLHRYRRQHRKCPCETCRSQAINEPNRYEGLTKARCGPCPCGGSGTLFRKRGQSEPPRCAVCVGILSGRPVEVTPHVFTPVPPKPYPWLGEERMEVGIRLLVRRFCLACGEAVEVEGVKRGRVTRYPGFARWYREHIPCGKDWKTEEEAKTETQGVNQ